MSVITKKGDGGKTEVRGKMVDKSSEMVEALGNIDELNCYLGWLKLVLKDKEIELLQKDMWQISGYLACNNKIDLEKRIKWLETSINSIEKNLTVLKNFVVPGINEKEAMCQICRSVSRRVERSLWQLNKYIKVDKDILVYFNRLSDYLFILGRLRFTTASRGRFAKK